VFVLALTSINVKIDKDLKAEADKLFNALGMSVSTAVNIFVRQAVQKQAIPFEIALNEKSEFNALLTSMRAKAARHGFMSDDEINAEIAAARTESGTLGKITLDSLDAEIAAYQQEQV
jgi:DNA-damage-inducible protein J